jgi:AraC-like DNA-binding protein
MELAGRIHRFALRELGGPALVGVGESVPRGEPLGESYRHAVLALHLGSQSGKDISSHDSTLELGTKGLLELHRLLSAMGRQLALASLADMEVLQNTYLEQVLTLSFQNPVEIRWHLQYAHIHLTEALRQRLHLGERETNGIYQELALSLEKAATTHDLVLTFKAALTKLLERTERRNALNAAGSVRGAREHIDTHFREALPIGSLARMAGVSASTFSRHFKKMTGIGLEPYLLNLRLEEAKRLMKTGGLPVSRVAQDCGFHSSAYFVKVFGKRLGMTPGDYRRKFQ